MKMNTELPEENKASVNSKDAGISNVMPRFIQIESCINCPNKFPTFSSEYRCTIKELHPLPENGEIHKDCPLPILNEA